MITPLTKDVPNHTILGVLTCLKNIVPHLDMGTTNQGIKGSFGTKKSIPTNKKNQSLEMKQYLQVN